MAVTKIMNIKNSKGSEKKAGKHLINALEYITNPEKTGNGLYVGAVNCIANPKGAYVQMTNTKRKLNTGGSRQAYHFVLSCAEEEGTPEIMMEITQRFLEEYLKDNYEVLYAVHNNTDKIHSHIIFNSVSFRTGKKYRYENGDWEKIIQPIVNRLCEEYGLSKLELEEDGKEKIKEKNQRKKLKNDIDDAIKKSSSYDEFLNMIGEKYKIKYGNYLAMKPPNGKKYLRVKGIGDIYSEEMIKLRIAMQTGYFKKYTYGYNRKIKTFRVNYNFLKKLKYKKMNPYQKWVLKKYIKQKKIRDCNYAAGTWKYKDDIKKLKEAQEEYFFIAKNRITSSKELQDILAELTAKKISVGTERKKFNTEGKIYEGIIEKYNRLKELEYRYQIYLSEKSEMFKEAYEEYLQIQKEIQDMGTDLNSIREYLDNVKHKKEEFTSRRVSLSKDIKIIERLILKEKKDGLYYFEQKRGEAEETGITAEPEHNFALWSKTRLTSAYSFDRVLNHQVKNDYARDNYYIICDRTRPDNYIKVKSTREIFEGEEYTKSYYEVYAGGKKVMECDDGKFKGREKYYWFNLKKEMREKSLMEDDNIIFENADNFDRYLAAYNEYMKEKSEEKSGNAVEKPEEKREERRHEKRN